MIIYVVGLITHAIALFSHKTQTPINFNPIVEVFQFTFNFELSKFVWLAVGILLFVIIVYMLSAWICSRLSKQPERGSGVRLFGF